MYQLTQPYYYKIKFASKSGDKVRFQACILVIQQGVLVRLLRLRPSKNHRIIAEIQNQQEWTNVCQPISSNMPRPDKANEVGRKIASKPRCCLTSLVQVVTAFMPVGTCENEASGVSNLHKTGHLLVLDLDL